MDVQYKNNPLSGLFLCQVIASWMVFLLQFLTITFTYAQDAFIINDGIKQSAIRKNFIRVLEDKTNRLTPAEVASGSFKDSFQISSVKYPKNFHENSTYWVRFHLKDESSNDKNWMIEFFDHSINQITLYEIRGNQMKEIPTGNGLNFFQRIIHHKNFAFPLNLAKGIETTFLVKVKSNNLNVIIPELRSYEKFISYALNEYFLLGIFYGVLLIFATYNILLFAAIRKRQYFYYTCYILSVALHSLTETGLGFQYLWPSFPAFNEITSSMALFFIVFFSVFLANNFLNLGQQVRSYNRIIYSIFAVRTLIFLSGILFFPVLTHWKFLDLVPLTVTFVTGILHYRKIEHNSKYFFVAYALLYLTFTITILEYYGLVSSGILTVYSLNIAIIADIVLFSISFAETLRMEIKTKEAIQAAMIQSLEENKKLAEKVNNELEEKVRERTQELHIANQKLTKQAEEISKINAHLDILNSNLKKDVKEISQKRIIKPKVEFDEFLQAYANESACYRFLEEVKSGKDFNCKKCGSIKFGKGKDIFDRRCTRCGYNESITANTLFHNLKFPIVKAFYMTHAIFINKKITAEALSKIVGIRKETCSVFKRKVLERLNSSSSKELESWDAIVVDENYRQEVRID